MLLVYVQPAREPLILGTVRGIVHDPQHRPIAGADVKLQSSTSDWSRAARTNDDGEFEFDAVPLGEYEIAVTRDGFDKAPAQHRITIRLGSSPVFHIPLDRGQQSASASK